MGSLGQWQSPAHLSLSDPRLLLHQICLSFPGILTASCSQRDITNTCHIFVSSSGPTGALRYLVGFASHRKDLDFRDICLRDKLVYNFLSLPICPHCLLSLVAAWNLQKDKGIFMPLHPTKNVYNLVIFLVQGWVLQQFCYYLFYLPAPDKQTLSVLLNRFI